MKFEIKCPFGVEVEMSDQQIERSHLRGTCNTVLRELGVSSGSSDNESAREWTLKGDSTCGHEFTSPRLEGEEGLELLKGVLTGIQSAYTGQTLINSRCGLHVHLDIGDLTRNDTRRMTQVFSKIESFIFSLVPSSRRASSNYCRSISNYRNMAEDYQIPTDHFQAINFNRWAARGTVEIRYHGGTCSARKVANWIRLLQGITAKAQAGDIPVTDIATPEQFFAWMGDAEGEIESAVYAWIEERYQFFQNNDPELNRRRYCDARAIRDRALSEHATHRHYHYHLRREMSREDRRAHDLEIIEHNEAGTLLDWVIPEAWLTTYYEEHPEHRPEGSGPSEDSEPATNEVEQISVGEEVSEEVYECEETCSEA